jgi:hypothetical protein
MGQRYECAAYGASWVIRDIETGNIVAVRPDFESAKVAADRLNGITRPTPERRRR